jgi:hypothetical protein
MDLKLLTTIEEQIEQYRMLDSLSSEELKFRSFFVKRYSWAIPSKEALLKIKEHSPQGVVEIGAGLGLWAKLLEDIGVKIVAYDKFPTHNQYFENGSLFIKIYKGTEEKAAQHFNKTLFLCWPPYNEAMAYVALKKYIEAGGQKFIYIGEGDGGCTGDDDFHCLRSLLDKIEIIDIPQFSYIHDAMYIYNVTECFKKQKDHEYS